jgi:hypothetical protein
MIRERNLNESFARLIFTGQDARINGVTITQEKLFSVPQKNDSLFQQRRDKNIVAMF